MTVLALFVFVATAGPGNTPPPSEWRFVAPAPGSPFEHAPWRAVSIGPTRPDDVSERVAYRGTRRRYAQLRYGSPGCTRVTVVIDEAGPGDVDLYVDADRNRRIEARDRLEGRGPVWRLPLGVAIADEDATRVIPREIVLRLGATGRILSVAAVGYLEGTVRLGDRDHAARRIDGDADGSLTGPQDHLWIDLDDDDRWDPATEQFLYAAIVAMGSNRYAVRSDPAGTRLELAPLEGTGTVRLAVERSETRKHLSEIQVQLIGRDGSAVNVTGSMAVTVPVGDYRVSALTLVLSDPAHGPAWHFGFSERFNQPRRVWHTIAKGTTLNLDPLRGLVLRAEIDEPQDERMPGRPVTVFPRLFTGDELLINFGYRGTPTAPGADHETTARVTLCSRDGKVHDATTSGFS